MQTSPEPISPNPSFLGVANKKIAASRERLRSFKKSGPTTPSSQLSQQQAEGKGKEVRKEKEPVKEKEEPAKEENGEKLPKDDKDDGDATIRIQTPVPKSSLPPQ